MSASHCITMKPTFIHTVFYNNRHIFLYGSLMAVLVFLLKWLEWKFLIVENSIDIYVGLIAVFFTILGGWVATQIVKTKIEKIIVEKEVFVPLPTKFVLNEDGLKELKISKREFEVLQLLAHGQSNRDIADNLFVSISTVKTHVSNLLSKMEVKNRIQVIEKAKRLNFTP